MKRRLVLVIIAVLILTAALVPTFTMRHVEKSTRIGAYYYDWWDIEFNNHWILDDIKGTPFLGYYNSSDSACADQQIVYAKRYGIDFFAVSWMGKGDWIDWDFDDIDYNLRNGLLTADHMKDFSFCLFYETTLVLSNTIHNGNNFTQIFIDDMDYALRYFTNPSYLRVNGNPVFIIYQIPYLYENYGVQNAHRLLDIVRQQLAEKGVNLYIIGDMGSGPSTAHLNSIQLYSLNATTSYLFSDPKEGWSKVLHDAQTYYPQWLSTANSQGIAFVPNAYPGFNNTLNKDASPPWTVLPCSEYAFKYMLQTALHNTDNNLEIVMITSWNEWKEGTTIEPSVEQDELFLRTVWNAIDKTP